MKLRNLMENSIVEFLTDDRGVDDYIGLSVMTDGLKAGRDNVIGLIGVDAFNKEQFSILISGGAPDKTASYHGIPLDTFKMKAIEPQEAYRQFLEGVEDKYIIMHNHKFGMKFLNDFVSRNNIPPLNTPVIGTSVLRQATHTSGTLLPALSEDVTIREFMNSLDMCSYPRNTKLSLDALFEYCVKDDWTDYINRLPNGSGNAYKIVTSYRMLLESLILS